MYICTPENNTCQSIKHDWLVLSVLLTAKIYILFLNMFVILLDHSIIQLQNLQDDGTDVPANCRQLLIDNTLLTVATASLKICVDR